MNCLECFSRNKILTIHRQVCLELIGKQSTNMPEKCSNRKFTGHHKRLIAPFAIYVNFEYTLKKFKKLLGIILMNHILIKIKKILLIVMDTNLNVLMMDLESLNKNVKVMMQFRNLLVN